MVIFIELQAFNIFVQGGGQVPNHAPPMGDHDNIKILKILILVGTYIF